MFTGDCFYGAFMISNGWIISQICEEECICPQSEQFFKAMMLIPITTYFYSNYSFQD